MMRSHAIANGVFVAAANRTGEGDLRILGRRSVSDPNGNVLARATHDKEETLLVECDLDKIDSCARTGRSCAIGGSTPTAI